jgi:putative SOS response-associated peptidase YedK
MCYSAVSLLDKHLRYVKKYYKDDTEYIRELEELLAEIEKAERADKYYFTQGQMHPDLTIEVPDKQKHLRSASWGLIPSWTKTKDDAKKAANYNLNARAETIFDKASFRIPARYKRCIIYLDSFFEYYHFKNKTYPFRVLLKNDVPMYMAGLYDEWINKETGELITSCTIITTTPNHLLSKIHNNPKRDEARMPVILNPDTRHEWLIPWTGDETKEKLMQLLVPYPDENMEAYTVPRLLGKEGVGNSPLALERFDYPELETAF